MMGVGRGIPHTLLPTASETGAEPLSYTRHHLVGDAMAATNQPNSCNPSDSLTDHLYCLPRGLIPMPDDTTLRVVEKATALMLVGVWCAGTLAMTLNSIDSAVPPHWLPFTALVFTLVGKLWDLEVAKYLPGSNGSSGSDKEGDG